MRAGFALIDRVDPSRLSRSGLHGSHVEKFGLVYGRVSIMKVDRVCSALGSA